MRRSTPRSRRRSATTSRAGSRLCRRTCSPRPRIATCSNASPRSTGCVTASSTRTSSASSAPGRSSRCRKAIRDRDAGIAHLSYRPRRGKHAEARARRQGHPVRHGRHELEAVQGHVGHAHRHARQRRRARNAACARDRSKFRSASTRGSRSPRTDSRATSYKSQDIVHAANGTSIQVIHTDAEGRMVLADTLALASREKPDLIVDYATLTGACVTRSPSATRACSRIAPRRTATCCRSASQSGERVWPFPMDDDFDEMLKSDVADIKQCSVETQGDHILAARFLQRFVPSEIPWVHVDMSAGQHKGGLAHVPSEITGFGVGFTLELLARHDARRAREAVVGMSEEKRHCMPRRGAAARRGAPHRNRGTLPRFPAGDRRRRDRRLQFRRPTRCWRSRRSSCG